MEAVLFTGLLSVSKGFISHLIYDSYDLIKMTAQHNNPALREALNNMDLEANLKVIEALLEELSEKHNSKTVSICLDNVSVMLQKIKGEMDEINKEIKYNESKWFSSWRTVNYENNIKNIIKHNAILEKRLDLLIKIMKN